ncbi:hypothetical protein TIFTF001_016633 [Ficus carica]|uniref:Uncharacterized protein n=1 Tax=Ficus carica TaxID=3494 RepID=A0AA88A836_FICCA|nr:hypothetical protein TIFTF001_016633 [Ficus carica]
MIKHSTEDPSLVRVGDYLLGLDFVFPLHYSQHLHSSPPTTTDDVMYSLHQPPVNTVLVSHPRPNCKLTGLTNHPWIGGGNLVDRDLDRDLVGPSLEFAPPPPLAHLGSGNILLRTPVGGRRPTWRCEIEARMAAGARVELGARLLAVEGAPGLGGVQTVR